MQWKRSDSRKSCPYGLFDFLWVGWIDLVMVLTNDLEAFT